MSCASRPNLARVLRNTSDMFSHRKLSLVSLLPFKSKAAQASYVGIGASRGVGRMGGRVAGWFAHSTRTLGANGATVAGLVAGTGSTGGWRSATAATAALAWESAVAFHASSSKCRHRGRGESCGH